MTSKIRVQTGIIEKESSEKIEFTKEPDVNTSSS